MADGPSPSGLLIFSYRSNGVTVTEASVPASPPGSAFRMYAEPESGIALTNTGTSQTTVTFELCNLGGQLVGATTSNIPAGEHLALFLRELPPFASLPPTFQGVLRVSANSISVIGLRGRYNERGDFLVTTTPATNESSPIQDDIIFPHVVEGGGYTTQVVLFSAGNSISAGSLVHMALKTAFMIFFLCPLALAQDKPSPRYLVDLFVTGGGYTTPTHASVLGAGFGLAWNDRTMITFEGNRSFLRSYGIGFGKNMGFVDYPISESQAWDFSGNVLVNLIPAVPKRKPIPYVSLGGGYLSSEFITPAHHCCTFPAPPGATDGFHIKTGIVAFGGGASIPLAASFGIRPELKAVFVPGGSTSFFERKRTVLLRTSVSIYLRGR